MGEKWKTLYYLTNKKLLKWRKKKRYICNLKDKDLYGCDHKVNSHCTGVPQIQQNGRQKWSRQKVQTKMRNFRIVRFSKTLVGHLRKYGYQASVSRSSHIVWGENVISQLKLQSGSILCTYNLLKSINVISQQWQDHYFPTWKLWGLTGVLASTGVIIFFTSTHFLNPSTKTFYSSPSCSLSSLALFVSISVIQPAPCPSINY